jgi:hypothetical protein
MAAPLAGRLTRSRLVQCWQPPRARFGDGRACPATPLNSDAVGSVLVPVRWASRWLRLCVAGVALAITVFCSLSRNRISEVCGRSRRRRAACRHPRPLGRWPAPWASPGHQTALLLLFCWRRRASAAAGPKFGPEFPFLSRSIRFPNFPPFKASRTEHGQMRRICRPQLNAPAADEAPAGRRHWHQRVEARAGASSCRTPCAHPCGCPSESCPATTATATGPAQTPYQIAFGPGPEGVFPTTGRAQTDRRRQGGLSRRPHGGAGPGAYGDS